MNTNLKIKVDEIAKLAVALQGLLERLNSEGKEIPDFFFDAYNKHLRFGGKYARAVGAAFGPDGWVRRRAGGEVEWMKTLECGVSVIIEQAESVASLEVPASAFSIPDKAA